MTNIVLSATVVAERISQAEIGSAKVEKGKTMYEALIKALRTCVDKDKDCSDCPYEEKCGADKTGRLVPMVDAAQALEDSIDFVPVKHGVWEKVKYEDDDGYFYLYVHKDCGCEQARERNYCPNCGAKMDGERKDDGVDC